MSDGRTYIRVHDGMPDHPKVDALSDRAFRLLVESWCWCSRHLTDGRIPRAAWNRRATPKARRELVDAGLVDDLGAGGVVMHDYLMHQRSRVEVEEYTSERREKARRASLTGNHTRWHTGPEGRPSPDCELCLTGGQPDSGSESRSDPNRTSGRMSAGGSDRGPPGSHIGRGRGRGVVTLGGEVPEPNARDEDRPPGPILDPDDPRCARHAGIPPGQHVPNCRDCADVRRLAQQRVADEEVRADQQKYAWRAAVDACPDCDTNGKLELPDGRLMRHHDDLWGAS